jgi:hypothetical protein
MRCLSCNTALNEFESTRKYAESGEFVDLCNFCFKEISGSVAVKERMDLFNISDEIADMEEDL